jgi:L-ribulose-5-phosphate 3-epimerase
MRFGARAHDFGKGTPAELAARIGGRGFSSIQLALAKALPGFQAAPGKLSPGFAAHVREAFYQQGIDIAILGCYINMVHPDPANRRQLLRYFQEHLRFARDFGCGLVGTETGSCNADYSFHPQNQSEGAFRAFLDSLEPLVETAERFGVLVGIEPVERHVISTPARLKRVLDAIQSPNLQVIFDPVNLLSPANYHLQDTIIKESFDLFGDDMVLIHAKDFVISDGQKQIVPAGQGLLNYRLVVDELNARKPYIDIMLEDHRPETTAAAMRFLKQTAGL